MISVLLVCSVLATPPEFLEYNPPNCVNGQGILRDVESRILPQYKHIYQSNDLINWCHEGTHAVNSRIANAVGNNSYGFYLGDGKCVVLRQPKVKLSDVVARVPSNLRTGRYSLYLVSQQRWWQNQPLNVLDEWTAYCNGTQCAKERGLDYGGSDQFMMEFCRFADILVGTVKELDSEYPDMEQLTGFVDWQKQRAEELLNDNTLGQPRTH